MINIESNKIFAVSVIGSILFLFWFVFSISNAISYKVKKTFLIINIILFFVPFPEFKNNYLDMLYLLFEYECLLIVLVLPHLGHPSSNLELCYLKGRQ